jgi:putative phosphoribosyl transferase
VTSPRLADVTSPTLLIVGGRTRSWRWNQRAAARLDGRPNLVVVAGATHRFAEPGASEWVADLASAWFGRLEGGTSAG